MKKHVAPYGTVMESWYPLGDAERAFERFQRMR